jgi:hypothetical protein
MAGEESERHLILWEYDSLADYEAYKVRRAEYKAHDPYHMGVFVPGSMRVEFWEDAERELWMDC